MLAGGPLQVICSRQHLATPTAHDAEVVAGGTNLHHVYPVNGLLQELGVRLGMPTPFYLDSISTCFVASSDKAVKKSVWILRRIDCLTEGVEYDEIVPLHISEADMVADPCTKYLTYAVWIRHVHYMCNMSGDPPNVRSHEDNKTKNIYKKATLK